MTDPQTQNSLVIATLLHGVIDNILEGFQLINKEWRYIYVNETVAKQGKKRKEELVGKTMMECYPGIDKTPLFEHLRNCMDKGISAEMENEFVYPDNSKGWFQLLIHPWEHGVLILSIDITDRKLTQDKLNENIRDLHDIMGRTIDRELRMTELKEAIKKLQAQIPETER